MHTMQKLTFPETVPGEPDDYGSDGDDDIVGDIYIMMKRLFVTKNGHFLKRPVC